MEIWKQMSQRFKGSFRRRWCQNEIKSLAVLMYTFSPLEFQWGGTGASGVISLPIVAKNRPEHCNHLDSRIHLQTNIPAKLIFYLFYSNLSHFWVIPNPILVWNECQPDMIFVFLRSFTRKKPVNRYNSEFARKQRKCLNLTTNYATCMKVAQQILQYL